MGDRSAMGLVSRIGLSGALVASVLPFAACSRSDQSSEGWWRQRQAEVEQPQLWTVQALGKDDPSPRRLCTNVAMRKGFLSPTPALGEQGCARVGPAVSRPGFFGFRCQLAGREWAVTSSWSGDLQRDFTAAYTVSDLDGSRASYAQSRRYRRIGACPEGWSPGDGEDKQGRRVRTLTPWPSEDSAEV